eukprot:m.177434 g.177434  ORF g.177434 m.177434 type:complete len:563 (+) comp14347_c0_seq1:1-1689(+)
MTTMSAVPLAVVLTCALGASANAMAPNFMFILADDLGYNEMGFMNGTRGLITPNLDALANTGVILKNYYVQPICSPTRSALMTGRYTIRLGTQTNVIFWDTPWGVPLNETYLPQNLQAVGYKTAMFGKWHLGMYKEAYTPRKRGFDEHMGYYQGCESAYTHVAACCSAGSNTNDQDFVCDHGEGQYLGYDWFKSGDTGGDSVPDYTANHTNSATLISAAARDFLSRVATAGATQPWFLYLPFQNIHAPYTCDPQYRSQYNNSRFTQGEQTMFGYITEVDTKVGEIMTQLKSVPSQYNNTVIIFSSDNGAPPASDDVNHQVGQNPGWIARNYPFRGHKALIWEGGTRVAGFVHSPLLPKSVQGTVSNALMHVTDWLPTIVNLAKGSTSRNLALDGKDQWASITGDAPDARTEMLYGINPTDGGQAGAPTAGLRMGDYKVLCWSYTIEGIAGGNVTGPCSPCPGADDPELKKGPVLFNLANDPGETTNLATSEPDQLAKLLARLKELALESVEPQQWDPPYQGETYYCATCPKHPPGKGAAAAWLPWCKDNGEDKSQPCIPIDE